MSRQLDCLPCARRIVASIVDEVARVAWGKAATPTTQQRVITSIDGAGNATAIQLSPAHYNCDACGRGIYPGDRCAALTILPPGSSLENFPEWEDFFLSAELRSFGSVIPPEFRRI